MGRERPRRGGPSAAGVGRSAAVAAAGEEERESKPAVQVNSGGSSGTETTAMEAAAAAREEADQGTPASGAAAASSPPPESGSGAAQAGAVAAAGSDDRGEDDEQTPPPLSAAEGDAAPTTERRQSAQLENEVAKMLSGMSGEGAAADDGTTTSARGGSAKAPNPASVDSLEGLPVLPDIVRNKDLKRELPLVCHIVGCGVDLTAQADYYQRYRICKEHLKSPAMLVDGIPQRFCQQCGRFHELREFDSDKRNCRARLQQHNSRRRKVFAMSQELKRNRFVKPDSCLIDPALGDAEAMAAALAASGAWGPLPPLPLPAASHGGAPLPFPALAGDGGAPFAGLPALPLPLPVPSSEPAQPPLDPSVLAAAMAAAGNGLDAGSEPSQGGRGVKRSYSGMEGGGSEVSAIVQRMLQETARSMGLRPGGGEAGAEGLLPERYQQLLGGGQGGKDVDPARLFALSGLGRGGSQLANPFMQRGRASPQPGEGGRGGQGGWPPIGPLQPGGSGGQPSSTLLEQMARRVLLNSSGQGGSQGAAPGPLGGGGGSWVPPSDVREHPEAQALAAVYPELAAQIQLLSQQLQAVQAQLALVMPNLEDTGGGGAASAGAAPSVLGGGGGGGGGSGGGGGPGDWKPSLGGPSASASRAPAAMAAARQPPPLFPSSGWHPPASKTPPSSSGAGGGGFTAEDLLKAFAAGMQQSSSGGGGRAAPSKGGMGGLEDLLAKSAGLDLPSSRRAPPAAAPASPAHDLPPSAWTMLQALLQQPGSPGRGGSSGGGLPARLDAGGPSAAAIEQLTAALRAAGDGPPATGGRGSGGGSLPMSDMFAFLASMGQGSGRGP
ncbi:hypothetical protein ABPG75_007243 [Micractinium tetrahymenae]